MDSPRRSRRLAGLPPVTVDEEEYVSNEKELHVKNSLIYTHNTPGEFIWIFVTIVLFIIPLYLFLANS